MTTKFNIFKDSIIVNSASILEKFIFFILNIVLARYLSVEHFGEYTTALGYATFFSIMTDIGINTSLIRFLNIEKNYENEHFTNAFYAKLILAIFFYLLMAISLLWTGYNTDVIFLTLILGLVRIGNEFMKTYYSLEEANQRFLFPSIVNSLYVATFFGGVIIVIWFKGNYYHISLLRLVVVYMFIAFLTVYTLKKIHLIFNEKLFIQFIKGSIPFAIIVVLSNLTFRVNIIIISLILGTKEVGYFNNSIIFIDTLAMIPMNIRRILMPVLYKALEENEHSKFQFSFDILSKYFGILAFYIMLIFLLYSDSLITIIFGKKYIKSIPILKILSFSFPFIFNIASMILIGKDKQNIVSKIMMVSMITNIFSNIILLHIFGIKGAALSVVLVYFIIFCMSHYYLAKLESIHMLQTFKRYMIIMVITFTVHLITYIPFFSTIQFYISFVIVSFLYGLLSIIFLMNKDDIRIIKEMLGLK